MNFLFNLNAPRQFQLTIFIIITPFYYNKIITFFLFLKKYVKSPHVLYLIVGNERKLSTILMMTAGFCGTLMTPMAANFNFLPVSLLKMKSEFGVIEEQIPTALFLIVVHIVLMYYWAF
ncbi:5-oxoproline transporter, DUF979 family subunit [Vagococcus vulneris]|nr:DUF979 family protein [Vagococcus vulneris]